MASGSWKRQGKGLLPGASGGSTALQHGFPPRETVSEPSPPELWDNKCVLV